MANPALDQRTMAAFDMVGRTGVKETQIRYSDDPDPVIWMVVAIYAGGQVECAAGMNPSKAIFRLAGQLLNGGRCLHCNKETRFTENEIPEPDQPTGFCWYSWHPASESFERSCS